MSQQLQETFSEFLSLFFEEFDGNDADILEQLRDYCLPEANKYITEHFVAPRGRKRKTVYKPSSIEVLNFVQMERRTHLMDIPIEGVLAQIREIVKADLDCERLDMPLSKPMLGSMEVNDIRVGDFGETLSLKNVLVLPNASDWIDCDSLSKFLLKNALIQESAELIKESLDLASRKAMINSYQALERYYDFKNIDPGAMNISDVEDLIMNEDDLSIFKSKRNNLRLAVKECFKNLSENQKDLKWTAVRNHLNRGYKIVIVMRAVGLNPSIDNKIEWSKIYNLSKKTIASIIQTFRARLCYWFGKSGSTTWQWIQGEHNTNYSNPLTIRAFEPSNYEIEESIAIETEFQRSKTQYSKVHQALKGKYLKNELINSRKKLIDARKRQKVAEDYCELALKQTATIIKKTRARKLQIVRNPSLNLVKCIFCNDYATVLGWSDSPTCQEHERDEILYYDSDSD